MPRQTARVEVVNKLGRRTVTLPLRRAVGMALAGQGPCEVCVVLTHDPELRALNLAHRQVDEATDVLSFPAANNPANHLGDVVVSWEFAEAQSRKRGVKAIEEAAMLAVHGVLHLLGMDDQTEPERDAMVQRANEIMIKAGLPTDLEWHSLPHGATRISPLPPSDVPPGVGKSKGGAGAPRQEAKGGKL